MQRMFISICVNERIVQVNTAVDHVQRGTSALQNAKKLQKNSRKWMCIAIIILLLIVAIIVVGVIQPWKSNKGAWVWPLCPLFIYKNWVGWEKHLHVSAEHLRAGFLSLFFFSFFLVWCLICVVWFSDFTIHWCVSISQYEIHILCSLQNFIRASYYCHLLVANIAFLFFFERKCPLSPFLVLFLFFFWVNFWFSFYVPSFFFLPNLLLFRPKMWWALGQHTLSEQACIMYQS